MPTRHYAIVSALLLGFALPSSAQESARFMPLPTTDEAIVPAGALLRLRDSLPKLQQSAGEKQEHKNTGFLDFNIYPYTEEPADNSITINALANLAHGFQYFSLTNYGRDPQRNELEEIDEILTEQNLRWQIPGGVPIAIATQALIRSGVDNDALRIGPRWAIHDTWGLDPLLKSWNLKYWIAVYGAQFDHAPGYQWQIEHCFRWNVFPELLDDRVYVAGFADHNINHANGTDSIWLEEAQLGVRLFSEWYAVAEQRYNGFRNGSESSLGVGVEYVVRFK